MVRRPPSPVGSRPPARTSLSPRGAGLSSGEDRTDRPGSSNGIDYNAHQRCPRCLRLVLREQYDEHRQSHRPGNAGAPADDQPPARNAGPRRRPRGGAVHAPSRNTSARGKTELCRLCLKSVPLKCIADHKKVHLLQSGSDGAVVPHERRCSRCVAAKRTCVVARNPSDRRFNTLRCTCCLSYKETCSFRATYAGRAIKDCTIHPALLG